MPGREGRSAEALQSNARRSAEAIAASIAFNASFALAPVILFGHSVGALLAFETARALRRIGSITPSHLIATGRPAPHIGFLASKKMSALADGPFLDRLKHLQGTDDQIFSRPTWLQYFLPILRADIEMNESYEYYWEEPLSTSITVAYGLDDESIDEASICAWASQTRNSFLYRPFSGNHFFIHTYQANFLRWLFEDIDEALRK